MIVPVQAFSHVVSLNSLAVLYTKVNETFTGGRAAGDGETTAEQQFFFNATQSLSGGIGFPIANNAVNNGVGDGNSCLTLNADGFLSNAPCSPPNFSPEQTWIVGDSSSVATPAPATTTSIATTTTAAITTSVAVTSTPAASATSSSVPTFVLPPPGSDGPGQWNLCRYSRRVIF